MIYGDFYAPCTPEIQDLFLDMLEEAEQKVGFVTKDHKIKIEALAMADGNFVLTITRFGKKEHEENCQVQKNKKLKVINMILINIIQKYLKLL